jgi:hypothetical protein
MPRIGQYSDRKKTGERKKRIEKRREKKDNGRMEGCMLC